MLLDGLRVAVDTNAFYRPPTESTPVSIETSANTPELPEEVIRLQHEHTALDALARESMNIGERQNKSNILYKIADQYSSTHPRIIALQESKERAEKSIIERRLESKVSFAKSIGISTEIVENSVTSEDGKPKLDRSGQPITTKGVKAPDVATQVKLNDEYKTFRAKYAEPRRSKARDKQRIAIKKQIKDITVELHKQ